MRSRSATKKNATPLSQISVDPVEGTLNAYGERFLLIPIKLIQSIEDRLTKNFGPVTATSFEYEIGREGGANYVRVARKAGISLDSPESIQRIADLLGTSSGWGRVEIVKFDFPKKLARIRWKNGVSVRNKKGKTPVCHFGRGILTGAVSEILGANCESIEVSCQGKGDRICEAVIGEPREISRIVETASG